MGDIASDGYCGEPLEPAQLAGISRWGPQMVILAEPTLTTFDTPLAATFARLRQGNPYLQVHIGALEDQPMWTIPALLDPDQPVINDHLSIMEQEYKTTNGEVLARFYLGGFTYALASMAVAAFVIDRRVPVLDPRTLSLTVGSWGGPESLVLADSRFWCLPDDAEANHPDAIAVLNRDVLRDHLRETIVHLCAPLIAALRQRVKIGERALWIAVAESCAGALVEALPQDSLLADAETETEALIGEASSPLRAKPEIIVLTAGHLRGLGMLGKDCCANFKIPGEPYCDSCPHRPRQERIESMEAWLRERESTSIYDDTRII